MIFISFKVSFVCSLFSVVMVSGKLFNNSSSTFFLFFICFSTLSKSKACCLICFSFCKISFLFSKILFIYSSFSFSVLSSFCKDLSFSASLSTKSVPEFNFCFCKSILLFVFCLRYCVFWYSISCISFTIASGTLHVSKNSKYAPLFLTSPHFSEIYTSIVPKIV